MITETEIWENCKMDGFEDLLSISSLGRVKHLRREYKTGNGVVEERIAPVVPNRLGYFRMFKINNRGEGKNIEIHRLVAITFIQNPENKKHVNHINGIKADDRVVNLEWCTASENRLHATRILGHKTNFHTNNYSDIFSKRVRCTTLGIEFKSSREAARELGMDHQTIGRVANGKINHANGLVFQYL